LEEDCKEEEEEGERRGREDRLQNREAMAQAASSKDAARHGTGNSRLELRSKPKPELKPREWFKQDSRPLHESKSKEFHFKHD
jgi:hypothetical protein